MQEKYNCELFAKKINGKFLKIMKIYFLITILCIFSVSAENIYSQSKTVSAELKNVTLKDAFRELEKSSDYLFLFMDNIENGLSKNVNVSLKSKSMDEILDLLLRNTDLTYSIVNRQITISRKPGTTDEKNKEEEKTTIKEVQQTGKTITGTVTDSNGESIIGANIVEEGTSNGTITDINGGFTLKVADNATIRITYIGYLFQIVNTTGKTSFNVVLQEDSKALDEVVVVGYGIQKKENLTGAISTVNVEETMGSRPLPDLGRGLQGTVPGLSIVVPSGEVGSDPVMKIRGQIASISGSSDPLILVDNVEIPSIQYINPNDIEAITVLKDAAASSIYGAKAAFGVVLITMKKGAKTETTNITYSTNLSWQKPFKDIELAGIEGLEYTLDAHKNMKSGGPAGGFWRVNDESLEKMKEWQRLYGSTVKNSDPVLYGRDWIFENGEKYGYRIYDPVEAMIKNSAFSQNHNLSLNGRRNDTSYNLSIGYLGQEGMMKPANHDDYKRFTGNINVSTKVADFITIRGGARYSDATKRYPNSSSAWAFAADPWLYLYRWSRLFPIATTEHGQQIHDPYWDTKNTNDVIKRDRYINLTAGTTIDITSNWNIEADYAYTSEMKPFTMSLPVATALEHWYAPVEWRDENGDRVYVDETGQVTTDEGMPGYRFYTSNYVTDEESYYYQNSFLSDKHTYNIFSTYNLNLKDLHKFKFMLGSNIVSYKWNNHSSNRSELLDSNNPQFAFTVGKETVGGDANWDSQVGFFGRTNYSLMDKYLLEANLRYDATSKFPSDIRWKWYPSFSGGWIITNEEFMKPLDPILSFAKLRASWGSIGDQSVSNSLYMPTMSLGKNNWLTGEGKNFFQLGTPTPISEVITWQDIETLNLGLDLRLFNDKLGFVFEWFQRDTKNMIIPGESLPATYGANAPQGNFGNLRTKGWEIAADFHHRFNNGITLRVNANISDAITDITKGADWNTPWENRSIHNTFTTGKRYGDIYGYVTDRLYQKDDFLYDENGNIMQTVIIWEGTSKRTNQLAGNNPVYQTAFEDGNQVLLVSPGDVKFVDVNGDGYITEGKNTFGDPGDQVVIGNFTPRYEYGLRLGIDYKDFDASIFFQGVGKRKIWGSGQLAIPGYFSKEGAMPKAIAENYWRPDRTDAFYPRAWNLNGANEGFVMRKQSRYLLNMAYLKIKNITLGYTLPKNITQNIHLSSARFYVSIENFFTFDKLRGLPIDPETISGHSMLRDSGYNSDRTGTGNPSFRSASIGVQIGL